MKLTYYNDTASSRVQTSNQTEHGLNYNDQYNITIARFSENAVDLKMIGTVQLALSFVTGFRVKLCR